MKPSEVLRKAKALIDRPEKWFGPQNHPRGGVQNCALTALDVATNSSLSIGHPLYVALLKGMPNAVSVAYWNNTHTHAEVMQAFDRAIALAEKEEGKESDSDWAKRKVAEVTRVKEVA